MQTSRVDSHSWYTCSQGAHAGVPRHGRQRCSCSEPVRACACAPARARARARAPGAPGRSARRAPAAAAAGPRPRCRWRRAARAGRPPRQSRRARACPTPSRRLPGAPPSCSAPAPGLRARGPHERVPPRRPCAAAAAAMGRRACLLERGVALHVPLGRPRCDASAVLLQHVHCRMLPLSHITRAVPGHGVPAQRKEAARREAGGATRHCQECSRTPRRSPPLRTGALVGAAQRLVHGRVAAAVAHVRQRCSQRVRVHLRVVVPVVQPLGLVRELRARGALRSPQGCCVLASGAVTEEVLPLKTLSS